MDPESPNFRILMFPWLAHGHIFPFLQLAKRILVRRNFHIHLCTTPINFPSIQTFIRTNNLDRSIQLVELHLEPSPDLPPHYHTTKNLPSHLNLTLLKAFQTASSSFFDILVSLNPHLVIYDVFQPWAPKLASSQGIPAVSFSVTGAATKASNHHHYVRWDDDFPFPELCLEGHERESLDEFHEFCCANVFGGDRDGLFVSLKLSSEAVLLKTSRGFEGKYMDYVSSACNLKLVPVGPLVADSCGEENPEMLEWLSNKDEHSTVYIAFGSEYFLSKEEIEEIAKGLELCGANFIWVMRFPPEEEKALAIEEAVPEGFLDRVKGRGKVVVGWVAQTEILGHPSTGAFMSHCGWSSVTESMWLGVPIIGMPIKSIMYIDANMLVEAGVAVRVPRNEKQGYRGKEIAETITQVIAAKTGDGLRRRAQELSLKMRMEEGQAMDTVADHLCHLCHLCSA